MKKFMIRRLIKDLRDQNFTWKQIKVVLSCLEEGPYNEDWFKAAQ
jgi:hypothetical protein